MRRALAITSVLSLIILLFPTLVLAKGQQGTLLDYNNDGRYDCQYQVVDGLIKDMHSRYEGKFITVVYRDLKGRYIGCEVYDLDSKSVIFDGFIPWTYPF